MWSRTLQSVNEKIGGADVTKFADEFKELEKKVEVTNELSESIVSKTKEFLQPNPAYRALNITRKKTKPLPTAEGNLGESMIKYGTKLGEDSTLAKALLESGDAMKQLSDARLSLDSHVKQSFLEPITFFQNKDLKEVGHLRKEAHSRRLDYDTKRNKLLKQQMKSGTISYATNDVDMAAERFKQAYSLAEIGMQKLLENDVEQVTQLHAFAEELHDYHTKCADIMKRLVESLYTIKSSAASRPRRTRPTSNPLYLGLPQPSYQNGATSSPRNSTRNSIENESGYSSPTGQNGPPPYSHDLLSLDDPPPYNDFTTATDSAPVPIMSRQISSHSSRPCCKALYDFVKESATDLPFGEGDVITLIRRVDENWYEGTFAGKTGCFPSNYVQVIVPLP